MSNIETPANAPSYRGLLAIVIFLGALIMLGVGALVAGAFLGGRAAPLRNGFVTELGAPDAHIESAALQGDKIVLKLTGGTAGDEVVLVDAANGRVVGRITLK